MACKRVGHFRTMLRGLINSRSSNLGRYNHFSASLTSHVWSRQIFAQSVNSNGRRLFLVDKLALAKRLEAEGVPSKQAEAIIEVLHDIIGNATQSFILKGEMQKEPCFSMLQHETKKLSAGSDKMRSELSYSISEEIHALRLQVKEAKYELLNFYINSYLSISAIGLLFVLIL